MRGGSAHPVFFVSVASKGLSLAVSLLFATLAGRSISVAAKGLKAMVGSDPDRVAADQWTVVREEKNGGWGIGNRGSARESGEGSAGMLSENHMEG